jgi:hypothetical protein
MTAKTAGFLAYCLLLIACGVTETHSVVTGTAGAPRGGDVQILMGDEAPPGDMKEVALVQAIGRGTDADLEHVIAGLKTKALELGCTVVAKVKVDQGSATASGTGVCLRP